jgi:hypothetical protein
MGCIREKKMREASSVSKEETHLVIMAKKKEAMEIRNKKQHRRNKT